MRYLKLAICCSLIISFQVCAAQQATDTSLLLAPGLESFNVDTSGKFYISAIDISGNKKTKAYIILREMLLKKGDSVPAAQLNQMIGQSRVLVYNMNLFTEVEIRPQFISPQTISINVTLKERWYIYPSPQFKLVDRNLNEWLKTYNADLNRVIYGARFAHYNFSGRGDKLRIYLSGGYARTLAANYTAPYSNRALTEGFSVGASYAQSREISYKTSYANSLLQFKKDGFVRDLFSVNASYQLRRGFFTKHIFAAQFTHIKINDSIITAPYNPEYFNSTRSSVSYPDISYNFQYSNTNNVNYPLKGKFFNVLVSKRGLGVTGGVNMLSAEVTLRNFYGHSRDWYSSFEFFSKFKLPFVQPYINQRSMGYDNFYLRGLEYYVIDGVAAAIGKYTLKKKILSFKIPVPFKIKTLPYIPFTFFAKTYADLGYNYTKEQFDTRLNNRFLYSGGFGLDILTLYDLNIRLEYSFNQLRENGVFLHSKGSF